MEKKIMLPLDNKQIEDLRAGDIVRISGNVYSARDAAHKRLFDSLCDNQKLPFELKNTAIYYVGACPPKEGDIIGSCGPTTAMRMDAYTPALLEKGVTVLIGKGKRGMDVQKSLIKNKAVYFAAIGGAGSYYVDCIKKITPIAYPELLSEAISEMTLENFPAVVAIDCHGGNIYS